MTRRRSPKCFRMRMNENGDLYDTGLKIVVPSADSPLKAEMFASPTEFFDLPKFREWLAAHNLVSS